MSRNRHRVCLESGLKLDINRLIKRGSIRPGFGTGSSVLSWRNSYNGDFVASVMITPEFANCEEGSIRISANLLDQRIFLVNQLRHFGGRQWYFICPQENRRASVLWMPPGARQFACRQAWGRSVAYASQFETSIGRAHRGKDKIRLRLIGDLEISEWDLPPKPKWMRWKTYNRAVAKFDHYEDILDEGTLELLAKFMSHT